MAYLAITYQPNEALTLQKPSALCRHDGIYLLTPFPGQVSFLFLKPLRARLARLTAQCCKNRLDLVLQSIMRMRTRLQARASVVRRLQRGELQFSAGVPFSQRWRRRHPELGRRHPEPGC